MYKRQPRTPVPYSEPMENEYRVTTTRIIKKAKEIDTDILVTFDADGQHRVEDVGKVVEPVINGTADLVIGSRFLEKGEEEIPGYRKIGINIITKVTNSGLKEKVTDSQSGFRAYSKRLISKLDTSDMGKGMGISTEILIKASKNNFRISEVPITILYEGETSVHNPVSHGASVIISTIKFTSIFEKVNSFKFKKLAPAIAGTERKNEIFAESYRSKLRNLPAVITIPALLTPGINAST